MKYIASLLIGLFGIFWIIPTSFAAIDFDVTPIKYELDANPGDTLNIPATLINRGVDTFTIVTGTSDFEPTGNTGNPRFVRYSELVHPDQQLSTWLSLSSTGFIINASETKIVDVTINVPVDATPGGHYGAVFFKNNAAESASAGTVGINIDYGILILVNVSGEVVTSWSIGWGGSTITWGESRVRDICPLWDNSGNLQDGTCEKGWETTPIDNSPVGIDDCIVDFTASNIDGKCFDNPFNPDDLTDDIPWDDENTNPDNISDENTGDENTNDTTNNEQPDEEDEFNIVFDIPFENNGNTHIKPDGWIVIKDENGKPIKQIGEKLVKNERGAVIGKEIVDYLPLNDEDWNVLPNSTRNFGYEWKWFPYRDINWEIAYRTPWDYYTLKNQGNAGFLMFWERVSQRKQYKTLTADINVSYLDNEWKEIEFNSAQKFRIAYIEQYIGINPYVLLPILLLLWVLGFWFIIIAAKKTHCINKDCKKKIKRKLATCPACKTKQHPKKKTKKTKKK